MNTPQSPIPIRIDIVSDVVCPWCIIGYKQLERRCSKWPVPSLRISIGNPSNSIPISRSGAGPA